MVSPQHHLTLNRLVRLLHVDLRLPVLLDDEASTFMALHARCKSAADNAELPFLYTPGVGEWTLTKTRRLQRLHGELLQLRRPFAWEGDPGASVFHQICLEVEREAGGTLPALVTRHVVEALQTASTPPFHLSEVQGIIVLNAAPDFSEIERDLLAAVASLTPVHQLLTPGSFRLGYHGAYLVDQAPCTDQTLPNLVATPQPVGVRRRPMANRCRCPTRNRSHSTYPGRAKSFRPCSLGADPSLSRRAQRADLGR